MFGFSKKKPLLLSGSECTFKELGACIILPSLQGEYGFLFGESALVDGTIYEKIKGNEDLSQIFMACVVASSHFFYLLVVLKSKESDLKDFHEGVRVGFSDIQIDNKRFFTKEQVEKWVEVYSWYANKYIEDLGSDPREFRLGGSNSAHDLIEMVHNSYKIDYDKNNLSASAVQARAMAELQVDNYSNSLLEVLKKELKINL